MRSHPFNVAQLFRESVESFGDQPAIGFSRDFALTYRGLDRLSNQAVRFMRAQGVLPGDRIALQMEKGPAAYVLILAALKGGIPYFALDPRSPRLRTEAILGQCAPRLLFVDRDPGRLPGDQVIVCSPDAKEPAFCMGFSGDDLSEIDRVDGSSPAYLMFTSGSTGTPKGAVMSQDNLVHFIDWARSQYGFTPGEVHTHLNPLFFDNTVFDFCSTLFSGGVLIPFDLPTLQNPAALVSRLQDMRCTTWFSVPSLLMFLQVTKMATRETLGGLRRIIFGGEGYSKARLKALFDALGDRTEFHNVYGPTECTCICSTYRVTEKDFHDLDGYPPLGRLIPNFSTWILDGDRPVPAGEVGELCLGGPCVGLGYFNQDEGTRKAFVQNPLRPSHRDILYRTGDLVRVNPADGLLHFVGRLDLQVKHMGYRIELEEVQHALATVSQVDEVVVLLRKAGDLSELIAVVASREGLDPGDLRRAAEDRLPSYMRPGRIHVVPRMPKNANGKTDRQALTREYCSTGMDGL